MLACHEPPLLRSHTELNWAKVPSIDQMHRDHEDSQALLPSDPVVQPVSPGFLYIECQVMEREVSE